MWIPAFAGMTVRGAGNDGDRDAGMTVRDTGNDRPAAVILALRQYDGPVLIYLVHPRL